MLLDHDEPTNYEEAMMSPDSTKWLADGKGLCRLPRTAKGSGKVGYGKELLCRMLSEADDKGAFAISG